MAQPTEIYLDKQEEIQKRIDEMIANPSRGKSDFNYKGEFCTPNCHGTTLYSLDKVFLAELVGWSYRGPAIDKDCPSRVYVSPATMETILAERAIRIENPGFGDIASLWDTSILQHTGVVVGFQKIFNQMGMGENYQYCSLEDYEKFARDKISLLKLEPLCWRFYRLP